jgi:WhiB family redox-sensing transcriptional regulator
MSHAWRDDAACLEIGTEPFFPTLGDNATQVIAICEACPVQTECLEDALALPGHDDQYGIRGGLGPGPRARLRAQRNRTTNTQGEEAA